MLGKFSKTAEGQRELIAAVTVEETVLKLGMRAVLAEVTEGRIDDEDEQIKLIGVASALVERVKYERAVAERWLTKNGHALTDDEGEADAGDAGDETDAGAGDSPPPADNADNADDEGAVEMEKAATSKPARKRATKPAAK